MLAINDGVIKGHSLFEQLVCVGNSGGGEDEQAGVVAIKAFDHLAMEGAGAGSATTRQPHGQRHRLSSTVKMCGCLVDDLVKGDGGKVGKLDFEDGSGALEGGTNAEAGHGIFRNRGVNDTARVFVDKPLSRFESPPKRANILTVEENSIILGKNFVEGSVNGVDVGGHGKVDALEVGRSGRPIGLVRIGSRFFLGNGNGLLYGGRGFLSPSRNFFWGGVIFFEEFLFGDVETVLAQWGVLDAVGNVGGIIMLAMAAKTEESGDKELGATTFAGRLDSPGNAV